MKCPICGYTIAKNKEELVHKLERTDWFPCPVCRTKVSYYEKGKFEQFVEQYLPLTLQEKVKENRLFVHNALQGDDVAWLIVDATQRKSRFLDIEKEQDDVSNVHWAATYMVDKYIDLLSHQRAVEPPIFITAEHLIFDVQQAYDKKGTSVYEKVEGYKKAGVLVVSEFIGVNWSDWTQMVMRGIFIHRQMNKLPTIIVPKRVDDLPVHLQDLFEKKSIKKQERDYAKWFIRKVEKERALMLEKYHVQLQVGKESVRRQKKRGYREFLYDEKSWYWKVIVDIGLQYANEQENPVIN